MALPSVASIVTAIQNELGDPNGETFTQALATAGYEKAYRHLSNEMVRLQLPKKELQITYTLPANTTSLTPAAAGAVDFGELVTMEEKLSGSTTEKYAPVQQVDVLPERDAGQSLQEFEWRGDTWHFVGATTARALRITFLASDTPPPTTVDIDGSFLFLVYYGAAVTAPTRQRSGGEYLMQMAVGKDGNGGFLHSLLHPMVRERQRVRIQQPAYKVGQSYRGLRRCVPNIAAPASGGGGGGGGSAVMTEIAVSGVQDGVNVTFTLASAPMNTLFLFLNGVLLAYGVGYTRATTTITFLAPYIPQSGDIIRAYDG